MTTLRLLTLALPVLAACAAAPTAAPVDPGVARLRTLCADEHPLDEGARRACERDRRRLVADRRAIAARAERRNTEVTAPTTVIVIGAPSAGQGLTDYGRQMAAPPVRCTTNRYRYLGLASTSCQ